MYRRFLDGLNYFIFGDTASNNNRRESGNELGDNSRFEAERSDEHTKLISDEIKAKWENEQRRLKTNVIDLDADVVKEMRQAIQQGQEGTRQFYLGGVDISFVKGDDVNACAALVVVSFPSLEVVYEDYDMIKLTAPYVSGFLAFREVDFIVSLYRKVQQNDPKYTPDAILVDGNGLLHHRQFGLACHLGVILDIPCIGVAKKLCQVDGLEKDEVHIAKIKSLKKGGDTFPLIGDSGRCLGMTLRSHNTSINPIYVSIGHRISLGSATWLVHHCCKYRVPEPVRLADVNSREYLRNNFKPDKLLDPTDD
ncbi:endonuclease V-like [Mizuhopecten yessoensis]|uniref:Endonuclease V n=1 Tax=Mizuhopecten yessoensis TaxID=6573 RepID=A0A210PHN2_MIZYE|nr:endonuclease V-like [Mizuhopecten yessoensis]OWF35936.1 Endonuclease V [Mizuhopecten yessoensis]